MIENSFADYPSALLALNLATAFVPKLGKQTVIHSWMTKFSSFTNGIAVTGLWQLHTMRQQAGAPQLAETTLPQREG